MDSAKGENPASQLGKGGLSRQGAFCIPGNYREPSFLP